LNNHGDEWSSNRPAGAGTGASLLGRIVGFIARIRSGAIKLPSASRERQVNEINRWEQGLCHQSDEELQRRVETADTTMQSLRVALSEGGAR